MIKSIKFLLVIIVTLFLNFSYGSFNISPNYGKFKTGDKITIIFNTNKKVNNATLSYHSIKDSFNKGIDILSNVSEENFDYEWEIPKEINNDIGYFAVWNHGHIFVERSNNIAIINIDKIKQKRKVGADAGKGENPEGEVNNSDVNQIEVKEEEDNANNDDFYTKSDKVNNEKINNNEENKKSKQSQVNNELNSVDNVASSNSVDSNNDPKNTSDEKDISNNYNLYIMIGAGVVIIIIFAILFVKFSSRKNDIPTGKRSIKRFTLREEAVPPITKYNDTWKNTLTKNKGFNTLPSTISRSKKSSDEETEQLINGDNLISDAEKFARKHGLTDTEWIARKDYIPFREDELEIYQGNRIKVFELYDDLWCYGMNLDHYGTLSNDNEGMFPSSILPVEVITQLLNATKNGNSGEGQNNNEANEVSIDCNDNDETNVEDSNKNQQTTGSQFTLPKPLAVPLMPPKPLPNIPNLNRSSSLRSSIHRKRNSNPIDPNKSPLVMNSHRISQASIVSGTRSHISNISSGRHSQLSTLSNEIDINNPEKSSKPKQKSSHQSKILFISTNSGQKYNKSEDVKHLLSSPESDFQNKSADEPISASSPTKKVDLKQKQPSVNPVSSHHDEANTSIIRQKDEIYQQQLLIKKQREQLQQQQLEQQKLQEQLKQQQLQQQLQQQQIEQQIKQLQQLQQEKERQLQQQKQQIQQQIQQQQIEQEQLRIRREQQQIIQKSKLKEIEYERERLLNNSLSNKQDERDSILPSYSEAVNNNPYNNFASSSSGSGNMVEGFPLPPNMSSTSIVSPVISNVSNNSENQDPELYPRNASYQHQIQKRDLTPVDYPRNTSRTYVDEHPSIGRKIKQTKNEEQNSNSKEKSALKQKDAMNYQ
ncbi:hypothetical protein PIROE2DRAFT_59635 [Piromyces sp. E2]|nr:hypothetical protein PIROE2DRAFT_59635 [Piromyces sp. E2]|eukprot:OUM65984.1 hypothetical protein PIROE2DRAFT_59635 [Piromyces sp. E2]